MTSESRPPFVSYLLPTLRYSFRRHQSLTTSDHNNTLAPLSCGLSSASSTNTHRSRSPDLTKPNPSSLSVHTIPLINSGSSSVRTQSCPLPSSQPVRLTRRYPSTLRCLKCSTDLAYTTQIISKRFTGRLGQAYLVEPPLPPPLIPSFPPKPRPKAELVNTRTARSVNRELLTGMHVVADVSCLVCATVVGWKYLDAREDSQRYKIGKIILEQERVCIGGGWEDELCEEESFTQPYAELTAEAQARWLDSGRGFSSEIKFDSGDEEECESLFSGMWDRDVVAKRRKARMKKSSDHE